MIILLIMPMKVSAGDIPEAFLDSDEAQIFFATVDEYDSENKTSGIVVTPTEKIKGDVFTDISQVYLNVINVGDFDIKNGEKYLFAYYNNLNPTYVFETNGKELAEIRLKNISGNMWKRFEKNLKNGRYQEQERERIDRINETLSVEGENITLEELLGVSKENATDVVIYYDAEVYEISPDEFYDAIEGIVLTDIENVLLQKQIGDTFVFPEGMYITVNGLDGYAFITEDCKVDKYAMFFSRMPWGEYTIKTSDREKILSLFLRNGDTVVSENNSFSYMLQIAVFVIIFVVAVLFSAAKIRKSVNRKPE